MKPEATDRQLSLSLEPVFSECWSTLREFVQHRAHMSDRQMKWIAAEMDLSPSQFSRKLAESASDSARLTCGDLEAFIEATGDTTPIVYLVEKFITRNKDERIAELEAQLAELRGAA